MTRLTEKDIEDIGGTWAAYERRLADVTGCGLSELAAGALGLDPETARRTALGLRVGAVPVSGGEGFIAGFAESLASIAAHLSFAACVLPPDDEGFRQARDYDLFLWADDETYLAQNSRTGETAENGWATGRGFAAALLRMAERRGAERRALVLGAGPVGRSGADTLARAGYEVFVCDIDGVKARDACRGLPGRIPCTPDDMPRLPLFACLLDAAPTDRCFPLNRLAPGACIAAPCVPCAWTRRAPRDALLWHDPLQIGTAVMLYAAAFGLCRV